MTPARRSPTTVVAERCEVVGGDFFVSLPENADGYVMSHVLHDWDDDLSITILRNCRSSYRPDGRLLIVEMVLPPGGDPHPGQMLDMVHARIECRRHGANRSAIR